MDPLTASLEARVGVSDQPLRGDRGPVRFEYLYSSKREHRHGGYPPDWTSDVPADPTWWVSARS